jgi:hypothetical protein
MAKAILEYDLNDTEDKYAHKRAVKSFDMAMALWDITHNTKKSLGWALEGKDMSNYAVLEMVFDKIYEILDEHNINTDDLIL